MSTLVHCLAVAVAPRSTGSGVLAFPTGALGELEERLRQGTVRLSDTLEWTGPSDVFCEVVFMEFPVEQWSNVTSVLAPPANVGGVPRSCTLAIRTGPSVASNGGRTIWESRRPRGPQSRPGGSAYCNIGGTSTQFPYAESTSNIESPTIARRGQEDPHSLLTTLMKRFETMESSSGPHQASSHQPLGRRLLRICSECHQNFRQVQPTIELAN